jgi:hypothetical protein
MTSDGNVLIRIDQSYGDLMELVLEAKLMGFLPVQCPKIDRDKNLNVSLPLT